MPTKQPTRSAGQVNCIALDLGEAAIRVVEMELVGSGDSSGSRVLRKGSAPLPPHVWHDLAANRDAFVAAIKGALTNAGISGKSVVACMPRRLVTVRFARLPAAPPEQMKSMVMFEAQQYILFSLDEVMLDYHTVTGPLPGFGVTDSDDMETVLLAAARRSLVNELLTIFDKSGLELRQLSASALALAEHARDVLEPTALIDIQPGSMDVAVVSDGRLLFTRATALDLEGIAPDVAQRKLDEEVARSFTAYQNEFRSKVLSHVFLSGSSATIRDAGRLEQSLSGILEMPVSRLHNRLIPPTDTEIIGYATAIGMALQTQPNGLVPISLVPDERAERRARQSKRIKQQLSLVGATALVIATVWYAHGMLDKKARQDALTLSANKTLVASKASLSTVQKKHDKLMAFSTELEKGLDRRHTTVDVVVALHSALPPTADLWLTQLSYTRGGLLTLRGESKTSTAPTDLVIALQSCGAFRDVKLGYMGDAQETNLVAAPAAAPEASPAAAAPQNPLPGFPPGGPGATPTGQPTTIMPGGAPQMGPGIQPGAAPGSRPTFQPGAQPGAFPGTAPSGAPGFTPGFTPQGGAPPTPIIISPSPQSSTGSSSAPAAGKQIIIQPDKPATSSAATVVKPKQPRQRPNSVPVGATPGAITAALSGRSRLSTPAVPGPVKTAVTVAPRASSNPVRKQPAAAASSKVLGSNKVTRTSFIITCRVNQNSVDLLAGLNLTKHKAISSASASGGTTKPAISSGSDGSDDTGESDGN